VFPQVGEGWGRGGRGGLEREREREVLAVLGSTKAEDGWGRELPLTVWRQFPAPTGG
jgi:hypothetical protein